MKPLLIAIGVAVSLVGVAAVVGFLLLAGDDGPSETATTSSGSSETARGQDATSSATESPTGTPIRASGTLGLGSEQLPQQLLEQEALPTLPWQEDDLTDLEASVAESLAAIESAAPRAAWTLIDVEWLADEMTLDDALAITVFQGLAEVAPGLAGEVAGLPWLADELEDEEVLALAAMGDLAAVGPEALAAVLETEWLRDGIGEQDQFTLAILKDIAEEDLVLAQRMAESPDLADGISGAELAAFTGSDNYYLERIERESPAVAEIVKGYSWISGSASRTGGGRGPNMLASPLLDDGLTRDARWGLSSIANISRLDEALGERVANWSWVADGITREESHALQTMGAIARRDISLARGIADLPWMGDGQLTINELVAVDRVLRLLYIPELRELADLLVDQPWFQDSITGAEAAVLRVMRTNSAIDKAFFPESFARQLIQNPQVQSRTLPLPFGELNLHVVSRNPLGAEAEEIFEGSLRAMSVLEDYMDQAWGGTDYTIYVEPDYQYISDSAGFYAGSYVMIASFRPLYHELAHGFSHKGPKWLVEGGAEFLTRHIQARDLAGRLEEINQWMGADCDGAANIHDRNLSTGWMPRSMWLEIRGCDYTLGERFLLALDVNLGHEMVQGSLRELMLRTDFPRDLYAREEVIYNVMLSHVPAGREAEFNELYAQYHGRPLGYVHQPPPATGERGALVALYNAAGGPGWERQRFWLGEAPIGLWHGVSTEDGATPTQVQGWKGEDRSGAVTHLVLLANGMVGQLPPEMGNLAGLKHITMFQNQLAGPLPPEMGRLENLEGVFISSNHLSGPLPPQLGNLRNLVRLNLNDNRITGPIPPELGNLPSLESLELSGNQLSGPVPAELGNLTRLRDLSLGNNALTGVIPGELANLTRLQIFSLAGNQFTGCVPGGLVPLLSQHEFTALGLPACGDAVPLLGDTGGDQAALLAVYHAAGGPNWEIPSTNPINQWHPDNPLESWYGVKVDGFGRVSEFHLYGVEGVQGSLPPEIGNLTGLRDLSLENANLSGPLPAEIGNLVNLRNLDLSGNQLSGSLPPEIGNLVNLRILDLSDNQLSGSLPPEIGNLSSIEFLHLSRNQLSGPLPPEMGQLVSLKSLMLGGNPISGQIPSEFASLTNLSTLSIGDTQLTGCLPGDLPLHGVARYERCAETTLAVGDDAALLLAIHNSIPGGLRIAMQDLPVAEWPGVTFNEGGRIVELQLAVEPPANVNVSIPKEVGQFTELKSLNILYQFSGQIPAEIGNLTKLESLSISSTNLTGPLPPELGKLTSLKSLALGENQFGSPLPPEIGNLSSLELLQFIDAGLTGPLPAELGNLTSLVYLNLADNQLTGPIPPEFGNLKNLEQLYLGDNQLSGAVPAFFADMPALERLNLDGNQLTGCLPYISRRSFSTDTCQDRP
ncbi:MAG: leucine-rich repeat domain-containing protein [Chloroflexota bacterium]|nr:leucine-rich repeat domain-containing protein [Chloroflexota bacterium]